MTTRIEDAKVLFICKERLNSYKNSVGLVNSALFVTRKLIELGAQAKVVTVVDANAIDKEVYDYRPTHVIIEALWVTPAKYSVLLSKYPNITWITRVHSKAAFLSNEGIALDWMVKYRDELYPNYSNFYISTNNEEFGNDLNYTLDLGSIYLPNIYDPSYVENLELPPKFPRSGVINIGCFGAIRPMKNTLIQGMAAIIFGNQEDLKVRFHVNAGRVEQNGASHLRNLEELFAGTGHHELVKHEWFSHDDFLALISSMDLGMQVSFSETFNIVTADMVALGVPVVVSEEVDWITPIFQASTSSTEDIVDTMKVALTFGRVGAWLNYHRLEKYAQEATDQWVKIIEEY